MMNNNQDEKGRFKKGNTCGGRKKIPEEFSDAVLSYSNEALQTIVRIMKSKKESASVRLRAAQYLLDRGFGYPQATVFEENTIIPDDGFLEALQGQIGLVFSNEADEPKDLEYYLGV